MGGGGGSRASYPTAVTGGVICIESIHNRSTPHYIHPLVFVLDLSRVILTNNSLKTYFITGTLNFNDLAASVVNYSSNIDLMTGSSSNGDILNADKV